MVALALMESIAIPAHVKRDSMGATVSSNMSHIAYVCKIELEKRNLPLNFNTHCKV